MLKGMPRPEMTLDTEAFWKGCQQGRFIIQRCRFCAKLRWPPGPMCPECQSMEWDELDASGFGSLYSWVVVTHATHPALVDQVPYNVGLIELDEGIRVVGNVVDLPSAQLKPGLRVVMVFEENDEGFKIPNFRARPD
jgi:uncharacterized OB-fold protein